MGVFGISKKNLIYQVERNRPNVLQASHHLHAFLNDSSGCSLIIIFRDLQITSLSVFLKHT